MDAPCGVGTPWRSSRLRPAGEFRPNPRLGCSLLASGLGPRHSAPVMRAQKGLRAGRDYATTEGCRRQALLGFFGDEARVCRGCDVCGEGGVGTASSVKVLHHQ